jgi:hypothetical protein
LAPDLATVESYHVLLAGPESSCTCKGNSYTGHCKHVEGLQELVGKGRLPYRSAGDLARNATDDFDQAEADEYHAWLDRVDNQPDPDGPRPAA